MAVNAVIGAARAAGAGRTGNRQPRDFTCERKRHDLPPALPRELPRFGLMKEVSIRLRLFGLVSAAFHT